MNKRNQIKPEYSKTTVRTMRWTGLAIALLLSIYVGIMLARNYSIYNNAGGTVIVAAILAVFCLLSFVRPPRGRRWINVAFVVYYLSMLTLSLRINLVQSIEIAAVLWLILLTTTGIVLGRRWLLFGDITAFASCLLGLVIGGIATADNIVLLFAMLGMTSFVSYYFYALRESGLIYLRDYDRLKLRERLQTRRLRTVVNGLQDAIFSVDDTGVVRLYNSAAMSLLNTNRDLIGLSIDNLLHLANENGDVVSVKSLVSDIRGSVVRDDLLLVYGEDDKINLHLSLLPIRENFGSNSRQGSPDQGGYIIIARDITKQKSLDDERDEFISVVSHELRTPVAIAEGALSNLQFLIERKADMSTFVTTLNAAHDQILYLGKMVNDLSTLSRAQRGVYMDNEDIEIEPFMNSLKAKYQKEADERKLKLILTIKQKGAVVVPSMAIEEIMQNIITNSLKYTRKGSVTIGVEPGSDREHARFYVSDTGIGMSKSDLHHIFQRFWRSEDYRTRETSGTGLGLHVVDQLAQKIGTKIVVSSELNVGSTFSFELPLHTAKE